MSIPQSAIPVARQTLPISDAQHGLMAMSPPNPGMNNADDRGAMSKPYINAQPQYAQQLANQEAIQNMNTAGPQAAAGARGQVIAQVTDQSNAQYKAQELMNQTAAQILQDQGNDTALMKMAAINQSPAKDIFLNDIAVGRATAAGESGALGAYDANVARYRPA